MEEDCSPCRSAFGTSKAKEWAARAQHQVEELTLPSGQVIKARRPGPMQLMTWQALPLSLVNAAVGEEASAVHLAAQLSPQQIAEQAAFYRDVLVWCCVEPRVSLTPQGEDEIHPRDIPEQDWTFIIAWALRLTEAQPLASFRGERADGSGGRDGGGVALPPERVDGN